MAPATQALTAGNGDHEKAFRTAQARAALAGYSLSRSDPADGPVIYFASRWGLVRELQRNADLDAFLRRVGAPE